MTKIFSLFIVIKEYINIQYLEQKMLVKSTFYIKMCKFAIFQNLFEFNFYASAQILNEKSLFNISLIQILSVKTVKKFHQSVKLSKYYF